jgi:hypothetical protein
MPSEQGQHKFVHLNLFTRIVSSLKKFSSKGRRIPGLFLWSDHAPIPNKTIASISGFQLTP